MGHPSEAFSIRIKSPGFTDRNIEGSVSVLPTMFTALAGLISSPLLIGVGPKKMQNAEPWTIIVSKDTESYVGDDGKLHYQRVSGYGFTNDLGEIDLSDSVCVCYGDDYIPGLDPDVDLANNIVVDPGAYKDYEECRPNEDIESKDHENINMDNCDIDLGANVPVSISLQNPYCFVLGGTMRCF